MENREHRGRRGCRRAHHLGLMAGRAQRILTLGVVDHRWCVIAGETHRELDKVGALPIAIWSGLPEWRDRCDDESRVERTQRRVTEADRIEKAGRVILDKNVG